MKHTVNLTQNAGVVQHSSRSNVGAGSEYMAILYHTRNQAAPLQHLCSPDILIRSGYMVDDLDIIEED